ncbi:MAG: isopentenyl transferase family protein, partial [Aquihabitans sp.]
MAPLALLGTTASGKSALAMELARQRGDVELVSVDSMQVYRGMDIGTAKPTAAEQAEVPHHVIDLVDPWETFEVHSFQLAVARALADIAARGKQAVLVGGTGM